MCTSSSVALSSCFVSWSLSPSVRVSVPPTLSTPHVLSRHRHLTPHDTETRLFLGMQR